ncbi:MAG: DNA repair protein RecO [Candidatus Aminicenantia bacterium]
MGISTSEAIILKSFNVNDQDKIVTFFTKDKGIIKGIAKGARKFGNRFGSSLEPLSSVKVIYYEKETKELVTIQGCDLLESYFDIQKDLKVAFHFSYFSELTEEFLPLKAKEDLSFRLLESVLRTIKERKDVSLVARYFEMWLLKIYGILPDFSQCLKCKKKWPQIAWLSPKKDGIYCDECAQIKKHQLASSMRLFLNWALKNPPQKTENISLSKEQLKSIAQNFQQIIIYHLERIPKTLQYLEELRTEN